MFFQGKTRGGKLWKKNGTALLYLLKYQDLSQKNPRKHN